MRSLDESPRLADRRPIREFGLISQIDEARDPEKTLISEKLKLDKGRPMIESPAPLSPFSMPTLPSKTQRSGFELSDAFPLKNLRIFRFSPNAPGSGCIYLLSKLAPALMESHLDRSMFGRRDVKRFLYAVHSLAATVKP